MAHSPSELNQLGWADACLSMLLSIGRFFLKLPITEGWVKFEHFTLKDKDIEAIFREIANIKDSRQIIFSKHALEEMDNDGITATQVLETIRNGLVIEGPYEDRCNWKANFQRMVSGDLITVVAALKIETSKRRVIIVTAWLKR